MWCCRCCCLAADRGAFHHPVGSSRGGCDPASRCASSRAQRQGRRAPTGPGPGHVVDFPSSRSASAARSCLPERLGGARSRNSREVCAQGREGKPRCSEVAILHNTRSLVQPGPAWTTLGSWAGGSPGRAPRVGLGQGCGVQGTVTPRWSPFAPFPGFSTHLFTARS